MYQSPLPPPLAFSFARARARKKIWARGFSPLINVRRYTISHLNGTLMRSRLSRLLLTRRTFQLPREMDHREVRATTEKKWCARKSTINGEFGDDPNYIINVARRTSNHSFRLPIAESLQDRRIGNLAAISRNGATAWIFLIRQPDTLS